eukprot:2550603-Pleurochrysis_carterae.AAC.3
MLFFAFADSPGPSERHKHLTQPALASRPTDHGAHRIVAAATHAVCPGCTGSSPPSFDSARASCLTKSVAAVHQ